MGLCRTIAVSFFSRVFFLHALLRYIYHFRLLLTRNRVSNFKAKCVGYFIGRRQDIRFETSPKIIVAQGVDSKSTESSSLARQTMQLITF
jgi:hypothetical protein